MTRAVGIAYVLLAFALGGALGGALGAWDGQKRANARWEAKVAREVAMAARQAQQQERSWQEMIDATTKHYDARLAALRRDRAAVLDGLRERPERAADVPEGARVGCQGATGAELSRPDAEFLVGEAARADELRAALDACYTVLDGLTP